MRKLLSLLVLVGGLSFVPVSADVDIKNCKKENHCIVDRLFVAQVSNIRKRGKYILLQVEYKFLDYNFTVEYKGATLIDSEGNEATIKGNNISSIRVDKTGSLKNVSLKFKAEGFKWSDTFDLDIKGNKYHGSIAFFDLKVE